MTFVDFMLARLEEDRAAIESGGFLSDHFHLAYESGDPEGEWLGSVREIPAGDPLHPSRAIVEFEAKRFILREHIRRGVDTDPIMWSGGDICVRCSSLSTEGLDDERVPYPCKTLRVLARCYESHPDFQREWKWPLRLSRVGRGDGRMT